jgi:hypothetical protein
MIAPNSDYWNTRLPDGGPPYVETDFTRRLVEPCNAITAAIFIGIVVYWLWRMRGHYREHLFICVCMPILLAGGIGGTIYHALRAHYVFFLLDVIPIGLLVVMGSIYLWIRLRPKWWHLVILAAIVSVFPLLFVFHVETHLAIVLHYIALALLVLVPVAIVLMRTRFRHVNLIKLTLVCFGFAILFRFIDPLSAPILPGLGTHWLWHIGGAVTTVVLAEYFYRLETEPITPLAWQLKTDLMI